MNNYPFIERQDVVVLLILMITLGYLAWSVMRDKYRTEEARQKLYLAKWAVAQEKRKLWEDQHYFDLDFKDSEYQRRWEVEIGAEYLYLMSINGFGRAISWDDYCLARKQRSQ